MNYPRSAVIGVGGVFLLAMAAAAFTSGAAGPPDQALTEAEAISQFTEANPRTAFYEQGSRITRVYGQAFSHGVDAIDSAEQFVQNNARMLGVAPANLIPVGPFPDGRHVQPIMYDRETDTYKFTGVYYTQTEGGIPVFRSRLTLLVRNEPGYPLVLAGADLRDLGGFQVNAKVAGRVNMAKAQRPAQAQLGAEAEMTNPALVIWAGVDDMVVQPRLAVQYIASTGNPANPQTFQKWLFVVDAQTGEILYQEDQIFSTDVAGNVSGMATQGVGADICDPEAIEVMPYARVNILGGATVFADENGDFVIPNGGNTPVTVESRVWGQWFRVFNAAGADTVLSQIVTPPGPADFVHNQSNASEFIRAEVNGYIEANVVRDFTLSFNPDYPVIANQTSFAVNVNISSTCNAFYDGSSINFFRAGGGCPNTANTTIVHHEYGHHLVAVAGSGQGAYGEGMGDTMGVLITDQPWLAPGFFGNCNSPLRNADNTLQYPCSGGIHFCGQLISGSVWSTRNELLATNPDTYSEIISNLAVNAILLHSGQGIDPSITIDYLTLDDDDDDILNGTPHYPEIAAGFGAHNMDAPELALLSFTFPDGLPDVVDPSGGTTLTLVVGPLTQDPEPGTGVFHVDTGGGFDDIAMKELEPNVYEAVFPASDCGTVVLYYFSALTTDDVEVVWPTDAPDGAVVVFSASGLEVAFEDDLEEDLGWVVGAPDDDATTGIWERVDPNGTAAQPGDDHTPAPGTMCYVTGQCAPGCGLGDNDVDNGQTTLTSPVIDLSGTNALISYWRWYSNDTGADPNADVFVVDVSNDDGTTWTNVETVGPGGSETTGGWLFHEFLVSEFVTPTDQMRVRFIASDEAGGSLVEAAVDDFTVTAATCDGGIPGDIDGDGSVGANDLVILLANWGPCADCDDCPADIDGDCTVGSSDLVILLANWG